MGAGNKGVISQVNIQQVIIPVGLTKAVYLPTQPAQSYIQIKVETLGSGATLTAIGVTVGTTIAVGGLATLPIVGYGLAAAEVVSLYGNPALYVGATGATCILNIIRGISDTDATVVTPS